MSRIFRGLLIITLIITVCCGCAPHYPEIYDRLTPNCEIEYDESFFPIEYGALVNWRGLNTLPDLARYSDIVITAEVLSVTSCTRDDYMFDYGCFPNVYSYSQYYVTRYDVKITETLKGICSVGDTVSVFIPTNSKKFIFPIHYGNPDEYMSVGGEYLLFLTKDSQGHNCDYRLRSLFYAIGEIRNDGSVSCTRSINDIFSEYSNVAEIADYMKENDLLEPHKYEYGKDYSDPYDYMSRLGEDGIYLTEQNLIYTSDDIVVGFIENVENFSGSIVGFSGKSEETDGIVLTVNINQALRGSHTMGEKIKIFISKSDLRNTYITSEYEIGCEGMFFLSCMDNIQEYHLINGSLQASLLFKGDTVYNLANSTEKALRCGFTGLADENSRDYYRILFSECDTKSQVIDIVNKYNVERENSITYGE